jgi:hypothetical protein
VKGNLIVFGGPYKTLASLQATAPLISCILTHYFELPASSPLSTPHPNIKWSRVTANGVPTRVSPSSATMSPDNCHWALIALDPMYTFLPITLYPSWVCSPSSYSAGSTSSLIFAFEDPDGSHLKTLLSDCHLFLCSIRGVLKKWKQKPPPAKVTSLP